MTWKNNFVSFIKVRSKSLIHTLSSYFFSHEAWDWWWACHRSIISHHLDHLQSRSNAFKWSRTRREKLSVRSIWTQLVIALSSHSQILAPSINKTEFIYLPKNIIQHHHWHTVYYLMETEKTLMFLISLRNFVPLTKKGIYLFQKKNWF